MKTVDELVKLDTHTTMYIDDVGDLVVTYDDSDEMFELSLNARDVLAHLREFFDE